MFDMKNISVFFNSDSIPGTSPRRVSAPIFAITAASSTTTAVSSTKVESGYSLFY